MSSVSAFLALLAALLFLAVPLAAQTPASEPTFSESLDVRVAEVEVVVTGPDGKPVQGLTREDFQVLEDGRPAEVTNVAAATFRPLALAVFLDETSLAGPARSNALAGLRSFLASGLKPGDRALLARWDGQLAIQEEWTGDAAVLGAALGRIGAALPKGRGALQERNAVRLEIQQAPPFDEERNGLIIAQAEAALANLRVYAQTRANGTRAALGALQQTLALLAGSPDRKVLLYVGGGLPLRPGADLFAAWQAKYPQLASRLGVSPFEAMRFDVTPLVQQTAERANAAGISFYALSLPESGAASADGPARTGGDGEDAARALRTLATATGGRVATEMQNPTGFLAGTERDLAGSYSVGYTPPPGGKTGRHKVEITVRGGTLAARYREQRFDALDPLLQKALAALGNAGGDANPLKLELAVEEETTEKDGRLKVVAVASLPLSTLAVQPQEHYHVAHLTLAVAVRDGKGKISGIPRAEVPVEIPNERLLAAPGEAAGYRFTLHLAPGESVVALAARDDVGGTESVLRAVYKGPGTGFTAGPAAGDGRPEKSAERPAAAARVESAALLMSGQEGGEIPLTALALPVPGEEGKVHVLVRMRMDGPALLAGQAGDSLRVDTALYALSSGGGIQASLLETVEIDLASRREAVQRSGVDLLAGFELKPGTYSLRLLARNAATGRLGVRTLPLAVPDPKGLDTAGLQPPPAEDPRPTARTSGLGPLDPPPFPQDTAAASQAAPVPLPLPETAEGRRTRAALRAAYREALARLAAGHPDEAVAGVAALEDSRLRQASWPAEINRLVEIEAQAAGELAALEPESLIPLIRLHQRLYEDATLKHRSAGSSVARDVAFRLIDLLRPRAPELARRFTSTLGIELLRGGLKSSGEPAIRRALEEDPGDEVVLLELAADAERRSDHAAAVPRLEELLRAHPENREARLRLAIDLGRVGRPQESIPLLEALIREETAGWRLSLAFQELARLRNAQGVPSVAIQILRQGLERLPGDEKLTLLLAAALEKSVGSAAAGEILAALRPEGDGGGGAARHRYNDRPEEPLAVALAELDREAAARRPALARVLEKTP